MANSVHDFKVKATAGKEQDLAAYKGKVLLIVNTASQCGFTHQYEGLEKIYKTLNPRGLVVLGFPCNQFGAQEPGNEDEIKNFCNLKYNVTFPVLAKLDVNGDNADPLFKFLKEKSPGILGTEAIKWNFTKFLIDRNGNPVARFAPKDSPETLLPDIEKLL